MTTSFRRWLPVATVVLLAFASTAASVVNDFTFDDRGVIFDNDTLHTLRNIPRFFAQTYWPAKYGGDGYRPVVITLFSLQWAAGHGTPAIFHVVNILLAAACAAAVYWCARAVLPTLGAWVAAALFAVHPVHVEVTGNVVGQSELVVALCLTLATGIYLRARQSHTLDARRTAAIVALFAVGLFTKEHAIVLPGILAAAEFSVLREDDWREKLRVARPLLLSIVAVTALFMFMRARVHSDLAGFYPVPTFRFLHLRPIDRIATMMNEMPRIGQLLLFPTRLSADYSPGEVIVARGIGLAQLPGIFICVAAVALSLVTRRRAPVISFGILWLIVAFLPVSNLLVPAGFITAERTLFLPSVGVVLVAGAVAERVRTDASVFAQRTAVATLALVLLAGAVKSSSRQHAWKDNGTFFEALMHDAPNDYRAHYLHGRFLGMNDRYPEMEAEFQRAIRIFPYDAEMNLFIADAYARAGFCPPAVSISEWTYSLQPKLGDGRYRYIECLSKLRRWQDVRRESLASLGLVHPRDVKRVRKALHDAEDSLRAESQ